MSLYSARLTWQDAYRPSVKRREVRVNEGCRRSRAGPPDLSAGVSVPRHFAAAR